MAQRASAKTTLALGSVAAEVAIYKTHGDPKDTDPFVTAGPNGGVLRRQAVAEDAPLMGLTTDPFAIQTGSASEVVISSSPAVVRDRLVEEGSGVVVMPDEVRRGIRREDGTFVDLSDQLDRITEKTVLEEMRIVSFISVSSVPRERIIGSYWLGPASPGAPKVLRLIGEAMKETRRVAVVRFSKRVKQSLGVITPHRSGALLLLELSFAEQVREPEGKILAPQQAEVREQEVAAAVALVRAMADVPIALEELEDDRVRLRRELIESVHDGTYEAYVPEPAEGDAEDDLLAQFESAASDLR